MERALEVMEGLRAGRSAKPEFGPRPSLPIPYTNGTAAQPAPTGG
jgi:hypothetical protein